MTDWKRDGNDYYATLGKRLELRVEYERLERLPAGEPRWNVHVLGGRLKVRSPDADDGKRRAEAFAKNELRQALEKLEGA